MGHESFPLLAQCLLLLHSYFFPFVSVQTIKHLRTTEFKPFVVFVKPPPIERLRETRRNAKIISGKEDKGSAKPFTVRERSFLTQNQTLINIICCLVQDQMGQVCLDLDYHRKSI